MLYVFPYLGHFPAAFWAHSMQKECLHFFCVSRQFAYVRWCGYIKTYESAIRPNRKYALFALVNICIVNFLSDKIHLKKKLKFRFIVI